MNDFQEQAKNWLRNVVKQNPDKIKAGAEKAGDLIDKPTGGKYAEKVDAVQQKVGNFVDAQRSDGEQSGTASDGPPEAAEEAGSSRESGAGGVPSPGGGTSEAGGATEPPLESEGELPGPRQ